MPEYTVKAGDTWDSVAQDHGVTVGQLWDWNRTANRTWLRIGQVIRVPKRPSPTPPAPSPSPVPSPAPAPELLAVLPRLTAVLEELSSIVRELAEATR